MTETEFKRLAAGGFNRVPLVLETFADLDTPLSIYLKLAAKPYSYLLESVQGGERFGRYSFIGLPAQGRIVVRGHKVLVIHGESVAEEADTPDPLEFVGKYLGRYRAAPLAGLPRFAGGLVGCFGYDTVRYIEPRLDTGRTARAEKPDPIGTPDIVLLQSEEIAIVDNLAGKLYLVVYADPRNPHAYAHGRERLRQLLSALREPVAIPPHGPVVAHQPQSG
ncbi:MAG TPA: anthranilate synthase component I, partial [Burkholderiales bacterium]|nr:anthranilate synthase component I [Burkholderiales bacterium]